MSDGTFAECVDRGGLRRDDDRSPPPPVPEPVHGVQYRAPVERADGGHGDEVLVLPSRLLDAAEHAKRGRTAWC
ncbi:hypothetical protein ACRAWF_22490 [Streptomyces sp. L7]